MTDEGSPPADRATARETVEEVLLSVRRAALKDAADAVEAAAVEIENMVGQPWGLSPSDGYMLAKGCRNGRDAVKALLSPAERSSTNHPKGGK